jgi:hypothetical protein
VRGTARGLVLLSIAAGALFVAAAVVIVQRSANDGAPVAAFSRSGSTSEHGPRPALTAAEERYIAALWPIHGDVERAALRLGLGQLLYLERDLDAPSLRGRTETALATYRRAATDLASLQPPPSLASEHAGYAGAIELFEASALELLQMFRDGDESRMAAAYPKSQEATDRIREIGGKFWPHEFPAH